MLICLHEWIKAFNQSSLKRLSFFPRNYSLLVRHSFVHTALILAFTFEHLLPVFYEKDSGLYRIGSTSLKCPPPLPPNLFSDDIRCASCGHTMHVRIFLVKSTLLIHEKDCTEVDIIRVSVLKPFTKESICTGSEVIIVTVRWKVWLIKPSSWLILNETFVLIGNHRIGFSFYY